MNTTNQGKIAEQKVADNLKINKHKIVSLNWKNRWCEIDIVSRHKKTVFFTEVKYRHSNSWGEGSEYVTQSKIKQMKFAAEYWMNENNWKGDVQLQVASVDINYSIVYYET